MKKIFSLVVFSVFLVSFQTICLAEKLEDVLDWYKSQKNMVRVLLEEQIKKYPVKISEISVSRCGYNYIFKPKPEHRTHSSECMYRLKFSCRVDGRQFYLGEAYGFMKYMSNDVEWIFCEIYSTDGYDDRIKFVDRRSEYAEIMDSYCRYLLKTYGSEMGRNKYFYNYAC